MIEYRLVRYKSKWYAVCMYKKLPNYNWFVIDKKDLEKVLNMNKSWYELSGGYIGCVGCSDYSTNKSSRILLDKIILDINSTKYRVKYTNDCKRDLRRENLEVIQSKSKSKTQLNNTSSTKLPPGIKSTDIPKNVYYCKPQSGHGEMFIIELVHNGKKYTWKSSSSKDISLQDKLIEIKKKLMDIYKQHPTLIKNKGIIENYSKQQIKLMNEFNDILKLSGFKIKSDNLIKIPQQKKLSCDISKTNTNTKKYLVTNTAVKSGRRHVNKLPTGSKIVPSNIPKYCWYRSADDKKGDCFIIDNHPNLPKNCRTWSTTSRRDVSTLNKFLELKHRLRELAVKS